MCQLSAFVSVAQLAAVFALTAAAVGSAFGPFVVSLAGGAAPSAVFWLHLHFVLRLAGVPSLAVVATFAALFPAGRPVFPAASDISGQPWSFPCSEVADAQPVEVGSDEQRQLD